MISNGYFIFAFVFILNWILNGLISLTVFADERAVLTFKGGETISGLTWDSSNNLQNLEVFWDSVKESSYIKLRGMLIGKDRKLYLNNYGVKRNDQGAFGVRIPIESSKTSIVLRVVEANGSEKSIHAFLTPPKVNQPPLPIFKAFAFVPGVGVTYLNYTQTNVTPMTEILLTVKLMSSIQVSKKWDIGISGFYNAYPITTSVPNQTIQILGANGKIGYRLIEGEHWGLALALGGYYNTSFASANATFGYTNIYGPQLYPVLTHVFKRFTAWLYAKYSPLMKGISLVSLSNAEIAAGGGLYFPPFNREGWDALGISFDMSSLNVFFTGGVVNVQSYTFGINYRM